MLKTTNNTPQYNEATPIQQDVVYIPLVNQFAYAGYLDGYTDASYMEQLPKIPFIVDKEGHGNYIAFEVKGDSMNNGTEESYLEGDRPVSYTHLDVYKRQIHVFAIHVHTFQIDN